MTHISPKKSSIKLGKAQARERFAPLIESLSTKGGIVEVTDYGKIAAVILGYKDYLELLARAKESAKPKQELAGSASLVGDLEAASIEISTSFIKSLVKTTNEL